MKDALGHGSNPHSAGVAGLPTKKVVRPLQGHPYHGKSDAELRYIVKDASEAAKASQSMGKLETKYNDQINDAAAVLGYRARGGTSDHPTDVASRELNSGTSKSAPAPAHDAMSPEELGRSYFGRVSAKNGRSMGVYGPHATREAAGAEALSKHPNAKTASTYRGHGMDIRWHNR